MKTVFTKSMVTSVLLLSTLMAFSIETPKNKPIFFQENKGQICDQNFKQRPDVLYSGVTNGMGYHLTRKGISYQLTSADTWKECEVGKTKNKMRIPESSTIYRVDINWLNRNPNSKISNGKTLEGVDNYYLPHCPEGVLNVRSFNSLTYENIYSGIDLKWYDKNGELEYDFIIKPNADVNQIAFEIKGAEKLRINNKGELEIKTPLGVIIEKAPIAFQNDKVISTKWELNGNIVKFKVAEYDKNIELIIDPIVRMWGTYYGGAADDYMINASSDASGNLYTVGYTPSATGTIIATSGSHQTTYGGGLNDGFFAKFNSSGVRQFGTYYGGTGDDFFLGCDIDASSNVFISGYTNSSSGISTAGSHQSILGGLYDGVLIKFNTSGVRQWGTYYGGTQNDYGFSCANDAAGNIFLVGQTTSSTGTVIASPGSQQTTYGGGATDAFLTKFSSTGVRQWGTYYGGGVEDTGSDCETSASGDVYICGNSNSTGSVLATPGGFQIFNTNTFYEPYLAKFSSTGTRLWCTYYGGVGNDYGTTCTTDGSGNVYFAGSINGSTPPLITSGCHQSVYGGGTNDCFFAKFNSTGTRQWGTYYGGANMETPTESTTDAAGNIYFSGNTKSPTGIATTASHQVLFGGGTLDDGFLVKFDAAGVRQFGTYYGSAASDYGYSCIVDPSNAVYLIGSTGTATGTVISTASVHQTIYGGGLYDGYIAKFYQCANITPTITGSSTVCSTGTTTLSVTGSSLTTYTWSTGSNSISITVTPTATTVYTLTAGTATSFCSYSDTHTLAVLPTPTINSVSSPTLICSGNSAILSSTGAISYTWNPGSLNGNTVSVSPTITTTYSVVGTNTAGCTNTRTIAVTVSPCTGFSEISTNNSQLEVYPNPNNGEFTLIVPELGTYQIVNSLGQTIKIIEVKEHKVNIYVKDLREGVYNIMGDKVKRKIVITK